jgi:hypothetical protein
MAAQALVGWKLATGVLLADDRLIATQVTKTPLGVKDSETVEEQIENGDVTAAMKRLRETGRLKGVIVCALDARRDFSITRKLTPDDSERRPSELLAGRLGCSEDALAAGRETIKLPGGLYSLLVAAPRPLTLQILAGLGAGRNADARLVSVTHALHARSLHVHPRARRSKAEIRVLPGESACLALLSCGGSLVATRMFSMASDDDASAVRLAVLSLSTYAQEELSLAAIDGVVLHMGESAEALARECEGGYGLPTQLAPRLTADPESASLALAHLGTQMRPGELDLFAELRPAPGLRQTFPIKAAAVLLAVIGGAGFALWHETSSLEGENAKLKQLTEQYAKKAKVNAKDLVKLHEALESEYEVASSFITSRVFWADVLREVPLVVPSTGTIVDLDGRDVVKFPVTGKKKKKKKSESSVVAVSRQFMLSIEVPLDVADTSPPEVAELTGALETSPYFHEQFPRITGSNVRLLPAVRGLAARIMVMCFPQTKA